MASIKCKFCGGDVEKYPDSVGAPYARFRLAHKLFVGKEYEKAAAAFQRVIEDDGCDPILVGAAKLQSAYIEEVSGNAADAAKKFAAVGDDPGNAPVIRAEADYGAARLYLDLGDIPSAEKILEKSRQAGVSRAVVVWNRQLDTLLLAVKSGDFQRKK
ncbi:MAG: tetratricopeptide repeat protein [Victivallaceae bacterium]|nr:tetratricopeptide repeat protein [Victivallaceae bacterium]